jgi:transmembrane sensor
VIQVSDQRVRVVGTQFNIRNYDRLIDVTVRRGVVEVYSQGAGTAPVARLTPGWSLEHRVGDAQSVTRQVDPDNAFAWTRGRLICDQLRVSEIVAYLNRRYTIPVSVSPAAGERKFSGVLELGDENDVLRHVAAYEALNLHRTEHDFSLN